METVGGDGIVYMVDDLSAWEQCGAEVRYRGGVLEQKWIRHTYRRGGLVRSIEEVWREVPTL